MTRSTPTQPRTTEARALTVEAFGERLRSTNPFTDNRINSPSPADVDVAQIHRQAFERLTALAGEACAERRGLGAVLWGEAGIGKSHLLSRLARWADQDRHAFLVYLHNLQASPENLPRSLLRAVVSILTWGRQRYLHDTPLYRLVNATVREALQLAGVTFSPVSVRVAREALDHWVGQLSRAEPARAALVDHTIYDVLFRLFESDQQIWTGSDDGVAALAVRWLSGDYLDLEEAKALGLPAGRGDEPAGLGDNQQIKQVLVALSRMALSRHKPLVLCFDQVDNLDEGQAAALFRFLEALIDSAPNLFVVTAGIQASLLRWRHDGVIQDSAWDRLGQFEVHLQRIGVAEAPRIVAARLERFREPWLAQEAVRRRVADDPLFPLGQAWMAEFFKDRIDARPRDVINAAREGWRRQQEALQQLGAAAWLAGWGQAPPPRPDDPAPEWTVEQIEEALDTRVAQKLAEQRRRRLAEPETLPPDAAQLAGLVFALLDQCRQTNPRLVAVERVKPARSGGPCCYDLLVRQRLGANGDEMRNGLVFVTTASAQSLTATLRRLVRDDEAPERVWLITDERRPLPLAAKGKEYYDQLQERGELWFRHVALSFAEVVDLDALQALVGLARSGDLEIDVPPGQTRAVSEGEVMASYQRQGRYQTAPVLAEILKEMALGVVRE